ncbi:MAG: hypothetical protein R2747_12945 [Pyrinomonadaceae bacterium]
MKKLLVLCAFCVLTAMAATASAQPRQMDKGTQPKADIKAAPDSFETRYEGGLIGFSKKEKGTLKFDDINDRLVFYGKDHKEKFSINYDSMVVIYPSSNKVQSGTGRTIGAIPFPGAGIGGSFIKKQKNYLVIQYRDPDVDVHGTTSFLVDTDELLLSVVKTLGEKAEMKPRGDAYFRAVRTDDDDDK